MEYICEEFDGEFSAIQQAARKAYEDGRYEQMALDQNHIRAIAGEAVRKFGLEERVSRVDMIDWFMEQLNKYIK